MPVTRNNFFGILTGIILVWSTCLFAQTAPQIPKIIPPSPNAATLQRYGDIPVSAYTGTPSISIPLYEIKSGDISVPVSISYNASGLKVADEAGRVGLGWALNAGGAISRNIIGKDDWQDYHSYTSFDIPSGPKFDQGSSFNFRYLCPVVINGYTVPDDILSTNVLSDFQPDQYSYNFNGHSGKFILRRNKDVVLNKTEKIEIKVVDANANAWEIKTADGFLYRFEDIESNLDANPVAQKSSWYLSKITSPTGRIVQFIYTTSAQIIQPAGSYFESKPVGFISSPSYPSMPSYYASNIAGHTYQSLYLSKITFDQGEVQFNYGTGRVDVVNDVQLNSVQIFSKKQGEPVNALLKTWNFNYSYFVGTSLNGWSSPTNPDLLYKRLKLVSVQESSGSSSLPPYSFLYNNENDPITDLPAKLSFARDHWGYFNGNIGNTSLIPNFSSGGGGQINPGAMGGERSTNPVKSQVFTLNQINYPTGGNTKFEYESNDFDEPNSIINDHSFFANYTAALPATIQKSFTIVPDAVQLGGTFTGTFDLGNMYPFSQDVKVEASFVKTSGFPPGSGPISDITYNLNGPSGGQIAAGQIATWLGYTPPSQYITEYLGTASQNSGVKFTTTQAMVPGTYTFTANVTAADALTAINIVFTYTKGEGFDPINSSGDMVCNALFGGGLRIKRITDYTDASTPAKVKRYKYHYQSNGKSYTYGRRMAKPNYSYYEYVAGTNILVPCLMRESDSNIPLNGSTNGVTVGYDKVEELIGENGENGKSIYEYRNQPDEIWDYRDVGSGGIPLKPPYGGTRSDAGNGNLTKQTNYANINGQFVKLNETTNAYQDISDYNASVVYGIEKRVVNSTSNGFVCGMFYLIYPSVTKNRFVLTSSNNKLYDVQGITSPLTSTTEYTYDNTTHLQLKTKAEYKSNGDKMTTSFTYPLDYTDPQSDAATLLMKGTAYMHALPVTQQVSITKGTDQFLTGAQINKYQVISSKVFAKETAMLENSSPININTPPTAYNPAAGSYPSGYVPRLFFDSYDASGNIQQVHKSDDASMTYIWDYYSNYPIAEITNATTATCAFTSFESDGKGNWTFTGVPANDPSSFTGKRTYTLNGSNNITKPALDASKIYVISYWSKTGSASVNGSAATAGITRLGWTYYEHVLPANTTSITISGSVIIDELRLFPKGSLMTTYAYEPLIGITSGCDANNRITYYEYDEFQRLKLVKDQDGNIIKTMEYKYKQ